MVPPSTPTMPRFLIEVPHDGTAAACARAVDVFLRTGSHFLTRADWGCKDDAHKAWLVVEVDTKEEARLIVPPEFRAQATIVRLTSFTREQIDPILRAHQA